MTTTSPIKMIYSDSVGSLKVLHTGEVVLNLNSENRVRKLGFMKENEKGVMSYYKHEKEKDVFRMTNAWSLNWNIIQYLPFPNSMINIKSENGIYRITKEKALECGEFMFFKKSGIEKKIYVSKVFWGFEGL